MTSKCIFCQIVSGEAPSTKVKEWRDVIAILPLNPVTLGHTLVLPKVHVKDAGESWLTTATVMGCAAELLKELPSGNLITSKGEPATQTVFHLHVHVVPRWEGDGLHLPWTGQEK